MIIKQLNKLNLSFKDVCQLRKIHLIGICGVGMSGIAKILAKEGYEVSGSDSLQNEVTQQLINLGIKIYFKQCPKNIQKVNVVVVSSAISLNNPEVIAAKKFNIPIVKRAEILAEIMRFHYGIIVAGTHGKTTTTAMITDIYKIAGLNPTFINGGFLKSNGDNSDIGFSNYFIAEADESDASFLYLRPIVIVITNIEPDHLNNYHNNFEELRSTFLDFLHRLPFYGYAVICIDDPVIRNLMPYINRRTITYGFSKDADLRIDNYKQHYLCSSFTLIRNNKFSLQIRLNLPGKHNALNTAAAVLVGIENNIDNKCITNSIAQFQGVKRRFDYLGYCCLPNSKKFIVVDDYGHHPTEIDFTIKTVRSGWPNRRLIMIFQPHRYTRTRDLYFDFTKVLSNVDILLILETYSAGENPILYAGSSNLCQTIRKHSKVNPILVKKIDKLPIILTKILQNNDFLLIQGAGTISKIVRNLIQQII